MQKNRAIAVRSGLSWGIVLALCELGFGLVVCLLLPNIQDYVKFLQAEAILPVATVYLAYLFLLLAVYFACGMITAKWLSAMPLKSLDIALHGALSGAVAEAVRSVVAVPVNLAIALLFPAATASGSTNALTILAGNAAVRLFCGLPVFILVAALIAGISAFFFSMIFFRAETTAAQK